MTDKIAPAGAARTEKLRRLHAIVDRWIEKNYLQVDYLAASRPDFAEMRERLNTMPGLVICNRAGGIEPLLAVRLVDRRSDGLIFAGGAGGQLVSHFVGEDRVIQVQEDIVGARELMVRALENMKRGGFVILFPSGKSDPLGPQPFKSGFRLLLKRMQPDWMVYALHLNPWDAQEYLKRVGKFDADFVRYALEALDYDLPQPLPPLRQRFDERFTRVEEWLAAMGDPREAGANGRLHAHFKGLFPA